MRVELLLTPDCPHATAARAVLSECLDRLGLDISVVELVGEYASPTVLVNGVDVMDCAQGPRRLQACRLDVPAAPEILTALRRATLPAVPSAGFDPPADDSRSFLEEERPHSPGRQR